MPVQADIVVTGKCHCRCWHCFRIKDKREDLSLVEIQNTLHSLYNMGTATVGITGGEPMLREDIKDIISMIPEGIQGQLYTTGHNVTREFAKFLKGSRISRVIISLDHYDENIACSMRNYEHAFMDALTAIHNLITEGIYTAVTVCVTEKLLESGELEKYFEYVKNLQVDEIRVVMPIPQGNLEGKTLNRLYSDAVKFVKTHKKRYIKDKDYPTVVNFCEMESAGYMGCAAGANYISINNDGLVTPCVAVPLSFGNIRENTLEDIFNNMSEYFEKSGRLCYGKISGRIIHKGNIDTSLTPLDIKISKEIAQQCRKPIRRAAIFECINEVIDNE